MQIVNRNGDASDAESPTVYSARHGYCVLYILYVANMRVINAVITQQLAQTKQSKWSLKCAMCKPL